MLATRRSVGKVANMKDARIVSMPAEKRWELLKARCRTAPVSIRGAARRVPRDVKAFMAM